jgi:DNA-binding response OmpR family regulator
MTAQNTPQVWIVDDDTEIRDLLSTYLTQNGFDVSAIEGGAILREKLELSQPNVIVLDLMMPGEDGLSLTRYIKSNFEIPILMLSARGEEMDRIIGLEVGADDYLSKPFGPRELLARLRALLRRNSTSREPALHAPHQGDIQASHAEVFSFGPYHLHVGSRIFKRNQEIIELTTAEFELLEAFVRRPHRVLSRDALISLLKGFDRDAFDRSIDNRVTRLRKKIEPNASSPSYIKTVRGEGYLFNPDGENA